MTRHRWVGGQSRVVALIVGLAALAAKGSAATLKPFVQALDDSGVLARSLAEGGLHGKHDDGPSARPRTDVVVAAGAPRKPVATRRKDRDDVARIATCSDIFPLLWCFSYLAMDADFYCAEYFCPTCSKASHCDTFCGLCAETPLRYDCRGNKFPTSWVGDGYCDDGTYLYDSELIDLNCPKWDCDVSDCKAPDVNDISADGCVTAAPTTATAAPTANVDIAAIQFQESTATDVLKYDYDCYRSTFEKAFVMVRGFVTAIFDDGFYVQDAAAVWSGVHVYTGSKDTVLRRLKVGDEVTIADGFVDERLGETQLEVSGADVIVHESPGSLALAPVRCDTLTLGGYHQQREGATCAAVEAERFEGVLVYLEEVVLFGRADAFGRVRIRDATGGVSSLDASAAVAGGGTSSILDKLISVAAGCDPSSKSAKASCDFDGVVLDRLVGVVRYTLFCDYSRFSYFDCLNLNKGLRFTFAVTPRSVADLGTPRFDASFIEAPPTLRPTIYDPLAPTDAELAVSIYEIQSSMGPDSADHPFYNCGPSTYVGQRVRVDGTVTARDSFGFYMQKQAGQYQGIYVAFFDSEAGVGKSENYNPIEELRVGQRVVVHGKVAESLGNTILEAYAVEPGDVSDLRPIRPVLINSRSLGVFRNVGDDAFCNFPTRAESYESVLVKIDDASIAPDRCATCFDGIQVSYGLGQQALLDDSLYIVDDATNPTSPKIEMATHLYNAVEVADLTGIVRYTYRCEYTTNPVYCVEGRANFFFAYMLSPRGYSDIQYVSKSSGTPRGGGGDDDDSTNYTTTGIVALTLVALLVTALIGAAIGCTFFRSNGNKSQHNAAVAWEAEGHEPHFALATEVEFIPANQVERIPPASHQRDMNDASQQQQPPTNMTPSSRNQAAFYDKDSGIRNSVQSRNLLRIGSASSGSGIFSPSPRSARVCPTGPEEPPVVKD